METAVHSFLLYVRFINEDHVLQKSALGFLRLGLSFLFGWYWSDLIGCFCSAHHETQQKSTANDFLTCSSQAQTIFIREQAGRFSHASAQDLKKNISVKTSRRKNDKNNESAAKRVRFKAGMHSSSKAEEEEGWSW